MEEVQGNTFSALQHLLKLSYSEDPEDQQKAAIALARAVEGTVFPAVSFGPLAHALCRLVPSQNRTVSTYSAKALKNLLLDDALRPQAIVAGVPAIVCLAIKQWEDEVLCLRELLGALQTLCWDKNCIRSVLQADILISLIAFIKHSDPEVSILALATLANVTSYADTLLLSDNVLVESLGTAIPALIDVIRQAPSSSSTSSSSSHQHRPAKFYAIAALANACSHPRLAAIISHNGGLQVCREVDRQATANVNLLGSKLGDCARTAVYHLSERREGDAAVGQNRYRFKWGTKPVMELSLASYEKHGSLLWLCFILWLLVVLFTFSPLLANI